MPLDPRKVAHIQDLLPRLWQERQKTVVFVYNTVGTYSYTTQTVMMRPRLALDPQVPNEVGNAPGQPADLVMVAPISTNFTGVIFIADTPTATSSAVAAAKKYEIIEAVPTGMVPGGSRYVVSLRRLR